MASALVEFVGVLPDNTERSQMSFRGKRVPHKINKCLSNHNCKFCLKFNSSHSFTSSSANRNYEIMIQSHTSIINCAISNCIYLIPCKNCCFQYVGETDQTLKNRLNRHRSFNRNSQKINNCKILCDDYQDVICKLADYTVQMFEVQPQNTTGTFRGKKETEWMLVLSAAFSYGFNGKI